MMVPIAVPPGTAELEPKGAKPSCSKPPERVALIDVPPVNTERLPPEYTMSSLAVPPDETLRWPLPLTVASKSIPPELTISNPPLPMMLPLAVPPETAEPEPKGAKAKRLLSP